jgi:hypothetical protein
MTELKTMTIKVSRNTLNVYSLSRGLGCLLLAIFILGATFPGHALAQQAPPAGGEPSSAAIHSAAPEGLRNEEKAFLASLDERVERIERVLDRIGKIGKIAESRSLENKIMAREQKRLAISILLVLIAIALIFPMTIWLLSRKRLLGLSGLSDEVAATILVVEERQAKLASILEEMQTEFDEEYARTSPDLKELMEQAKKFLEENKRDLERVGSGRANSGETTS